MAGEPAWIVIHMAHSEEEARGVQEFLQGEGFMIRLRPVPGAGEGLTEVCALPSEAKEARGVLVRRGY